MGQDGPTERLIGHGSAWQRAVDAHARGTGDEAHARRAEAYGPFFARFGRGVVIHECCSFSHPEHIELHDDCRINLEAIIYGSGGVSIGRHARIGPRVFIHSANHDTSVDDPRAFHERGYAYERVVIGDNCLISANVSIMPGVVLGAGSFVAAGAVLTRGVYPPGSRLAGVPARPMAGASGRPTLGSRQMAVEGLHEGARYRAVRMLCAHRGLVQFGAGASLPADAGVRIRVRASTVDERVWQICEGPRVVPSAVDASLLWMNADGSTGRIRLPKELSETWVPQAMLDQPMVTNSAETIWHHALTRLEKSGSAERQGERVEAAVAALYLRQWGDSRAGRCADDMLAAAGLTMLQAEGLVLSCSRPGSISHKELLSSPVVLVAAALGQWGDAARWVEGVIAHAKRPDQLAAAVMCASLLGDEASRARAMGQLTEAPMFDALVRVPTVPGRGSWSIGPMVAAVFLVRAFEHDREFEPRRSWTSVRSLRWTGFDSKASPVRVVWEGGEIGLMDPGTRQVSASLVDGWLSSVLVGPENAGRFRISKGSYEPWAEYLGRLWESAARCMAHDAGLALVRVQPWPAGARAAISVRYDIDRATPVQALRDAAAQQTRLFGGRCGSWFAIPGTSHSERLDPLFERLGQERGVHARHAREAERDRGLNFHSSPDAEYWSPSGSHAAAERSESRYVEMLARQITRPVPAWIGAVQSGRFCRVWSSPLHFPLEGSTADTDTSYFDQLRAEFEESIALGGHVVIGTHPDLNQGLLDPIAARGIDRQHLWAAPIGDVIDRAMSVLAIDAIESGVGASGEVALCSNRGVADLTVEVDRVRGGVHRIVTQLMPGAPRTIDVSDPGADDGVGLAQIEVHTAVPDHQPLQSGEERD